MNSGGLRTASKGGPIRALLLALALLAAQTLPLVAQSTGENPVRQVDPSGALLPRDSSLADTGAPLAPASGGVQAPPTAEGTASTLDYAAWELVANRAEKKIFDTTTISPALDNLRAQLVDWRQALLGAQSANSARIATLREQIAALGPAPADGQLDAVEIAKRRAELTDQLVRLQAPGIAAEEAYRRADGLIREIDRVQRERQADRLMQLWPMPINPANWPAAGRALLQTAGTLWSETTTLWHSPKARSELGDSLPVVVAMLLLALAILARGRHWTQRAILKLQNRAPARSRSLWAFLASLDQIIVPTLGVILLAIGLGATGMLGSLGQVLAGCLPGAGFTLFAAVWLGGRVFPPDADAPVPLQLAPEQRAEGRFLATATGLILGVETLRDAAMTQLQSGEAAAAVLIFPILLATGLVLIRIGSLMQSHVSQQSVADEGLNYATRLVAFLSRGVLLLGVIGPALAAVGYVSAGAAIVLPAIWSIGLFGLLSVLQQLVSDLYTLIARHDNKAGKEPLIPVLIGFSLTLATLPLFALIWGARLADITELWSQFREGVQLGDTRISPSVFLFFALVFAIGYMLTRLFQGALKTSILPRTALDQGGQNAIVSGVGYAGIFLAGLIAINSAGIDLSGLAIVAGALSLGIGFGLQTIVSNFVSGIILLIERPVSEGDWIEVGNVQGIVKSISVRSTRIQTFDRSDVIVPNQDLIVGRVTNWTRFNLTGRLIVPVAVALTSDSRKVAAILQQIAEAQPLVILTSNPHVALMGFGLETMNFEIRVVLRDVNFLVQVRTEINHQITRAFAENGILQSIAHRDYLQYLAALATQKAALPAAAQPGPAINPIPPAPDTKSSPKPRARRAPAKEPARDH